MKGTFGAINAFLIASALAGSAIAAEPAPSAGATPGATQSPQPAGGASQANAKHKHHAGMRHDKARKQESNS
jgi:hypothetical protein